RVPIEIRRVVPEAKEGGDAAQMQIQVALLIGGLVRVPKIAPPELLEQESPWVPAADLEQVQEQTAGRAVVMIELRATPVDIQVSVCRRDDDLDRLSRLGRLRAGRSRRRGRVRRVRLWEGSFHRRGAEDAEEKQVERAARASFSPGA